MVNMFRRDLRLDYCFFSFLVGLSRSLLAFAALAKSQTSKDLAPVTIETPRHTYEYVATALDWWQADRYCEQHFAQLLFEPQESEQGSFSKLLQAHHIRGSVWLKERDSVLHKTKRRRGHTVPVLVFRDKTDTKYVKVLSDFPALPAVTACAHLQWDTRSQEIATIFSYAVPAFINEFQLRGFVDEEGFVRFALIVHGHHSPYLPVFRADGQWHHFCVTWQRENGTWAMYADGKRRAAASGLCSGGPSAPQAISGQGIFIVGQDQDSLGGTFRAKESFSGNITDLHIWQKVLSPEHIERVRSCWVVEQDLVFGWSSNALEVESTVQAVATQLLCPGPVEECRVLEVGSSGFSYASCLEPLPFICHYSKDAYWQLKRAQLESSHSLARRVNTLAVRTVIPDSVFTSGVQDMNLSVALDALDVLATVLREGEVPVLEPSDLLAVLQLLKQVSDLEVQEGDELEMLEQLGQYYMEVTELILEEQNTGTWSLISQVIRGPMAVVELCDRMVSLLVPLLTTERTKITIQHGNIGVEVRELELSEQQLSGEAYMVQTLEKGTHDIIEVPVEEMQRLKSRGLHRVTVKNMWFGYGSLQRCLSSSAVSRDTAAPDGGQKYLGTTVGTAVISATLLSQHQEISASVRYRLQHRVQDLPDTLLGPVCAFWNFSLSPDAGGMWSTAGCSVAKSLPDSTACFCNHTTNFAILLQVYELERTTTEEFTLQTLTFIGCGVSFCALMVTFILFLVVGVPKSERTTVHKNLILALAAGEALLMFSELAKPSQVLCFMVTAFLHLFFMAAFSWMLVEGLLLWSKVVAVNMSEGRRMKFYYLTGWGLPVLIVGVTLATSFNKYVAANHCWLNVQTNVIWAFVGPVLLILAVNTLVLLRVVTVTVASARRRSKMLTPNSSLENQIGAQLWATAKPVLVLLPVLGLTWLCGLLVHLSIVWAYVFIVLNSLQGLYIFLVYAVYNSEVRNAIQRMKDKKKALSFTNCSHPINYLSSPRNTTSWDTGRPSPAAETALPSPVQRDPPVKNITNKGRGADSVQMLRFLRSFWVMSLHCRGSSSRKDGSLEELVSLGELPAWAELSPCTPSQHHVPNQGGGTVGSREALLLTTALLLPRVGTCALGSPQLLQPLAGQPGLAWAALPPLPPSLLAALVLQGCGSRCCCLGELEQWDGDKPSFAQGSCAQAVPTLPWGWGWEHPELGQGWVRSTCTREASSWLPAFSEPADINSIFCCLGQKSSPCSCLGSCLAGLAPLQLGAAFLPSSPITSVEFRTQKMWWVLLIMTTVNADFKDNLLSLLQCVQGKGLMSSSVWLSPEMGVWLQCKDQGTAH